MPSAVRWVVAAAYIVFHAVLYVDAATGDKIAAGTAIWLGAAVVTGFVIAQWWAAALPATTLLVALVLALAGHGFPDGAIELVRFALQAGLLALGVAGARGIGGMRKPAAAQP